MNIGLIKSGIQLVAGIGVGLVADNAITMVKPTNLNGLKKVAVKVGGFILSAMVADKATEYVGKTWDDAAKGVKDLMTPPEEVTEEEVEAK